MNRFGTAIVFCGLSCAAYSRPAVQPSPETAASRDVNHCHIAAAALRASIRPYREQPLGLERACVMQRAEQDGAIYVDARFTRGEQLDDVKTASCRRDGYVIRFDWKNFVPSPAADVVLLTFLWKDATTAVFNAVTEDARWPEKPAGLMEISQCGSAFGSVRLVSQEWQVSLSKPPPAGSPF